MPEFVYVHLSNRKRIHISPDGFISEEELHNPIGLSLTERWGFTERSTQDRKILEVLKEAIERLSVATEVYEACLEKS